MDNLIKRFAEQKQEQALNAIIEGNKHMGYPYDKDHIMKLHGKAAIITHIRPGKKYTKVDVGYSGKYMIDNDGNVYGIKGYGQINKKKFYGNLKDIVSA